MERLERVIRDLGEQMKLCTDIEDKKILLEAQLVLMRKEQHLLFEYLRTSATAKVLREKEADKIQVACPSASLFASLRDTDGAVCMRDDIQAAESMDTSRMNRLEKEIHDLEVQIKVCTDIEQENVLLEAQLVLMRERQQIKRDSRKYAPAELVFEARKEDMLSFCPSGPLLVSWTGWRDMFWKSSTTTVPSAPRSATYAESSQDSLQSWCFSCPLEADDHSRF